MGILSSLAEVARCLGAVAARVLGFSRGPAALSGGTSDGEETLAWLRDKFAADIRRNFGESCDPDGNAWAPLKYRVGKPLILTGLMMNSAYLAAQNVRLQGQQIFAELAGPMYWMFHEYGTAKIPARPFFGPRADTVQGLADRMAKDMAEAAADAARG